eukprot:906114_1
MSTTNGILEYLIAHKDVPLLVCFSVDAINTLISFPLIMWKGPKWLLKSTNPDAKENMKVEDAAMAKNKTAVDLSDTDRKSFEVLWEIFGICYEGYFGFTISTFISSVCSRFRKRGRSLRILSWHYISIRGGHF